MISDEKVWYVAVNKERVGPLDIIGIQELAVDGKIKLTSKVWKKGMADWSRITSVEELYKAVSSALEKKDGQDVAVRRWFYAQKVDGGKPISVGPFNHEDLIGKMVSGAIGERTKVWRKDLPSWTYMEAIDELKNVIIQAKLKIRENMPPVDEDEAVPPTITLDDDIPDVQTTLLNLRKQIPVAQEIPAPSVAEPEMFIPEHDISIGGDSYIQTEKESGLPSQAPASINFGPVEGLGFDAAFQKSMGVPQVKAEVTPTIVLDPFASAQQLDIGVLLATPNQGFGGAMNYEALFAPVNPFSDHASIAPIAAPAPVVDPLIAGILSNSSPENIYGGSVDLSGANLSNSNIFSADIFPIKSDRQSADSLENTADQLSGKNGFPSPTMIKKAKEAALNSGWSCYNNVIIQEDRVEPIRLAFAGLRDQYADREDLIVFMNRIEELMVKDYMIGDGFALDRHFEAIYAFINQSEAKINATMD